MTVLLRAPVWTMPARALLRRGTTAALTLVMVLPAWSPWVVPGAGPLQVAIVSTRLAVVAVRTIG
ncbi:MAG: hypothetical protein LBK59_03820 [Bifidobacteriaceae bacterium]|nr:hypothetical protein [Bifidobacteriaceae bacterium]